MSKTYLIVRNLLQLILNVNWDNKNHMSLQIYSTNEIKYPPGFYYQSMPFTPKKGMYLSLGAGSVMQIKSTNKKGVTFEAQTTHAVSGDKDFTPVGQTLLKYDENKYSPFKLDDVEDRGGIEYKWWSGELTHPGQSAVFQVKFREGGKVSEKNMAIVELEDFQANKPVLNVKLRAFLKEVDPKIVEESFVGVT